MVHVGLVIVVYFIATFFVGESKGLGGKVNILVAHQK
jgi:hypothetical protein